MFKESLVSWLFLTLKSDWLLYHNFQISSHCLYVVRGRWVFIQAAKHSDFFLFRKKLDAILSKISSSTLPAVHNEIDGTQGELYEVSF